MELIFSVRELFAEYLKSGEHFTIPAYQRGYKWKITDIEQLLDDIDSFETHGDNDVFYCLQNITIVAQKDRNYNVVDGQQRLTTLSLLLAYFGEFELIEGKLQYDVREESMNFLKNYVFNWKLSAFKNNASQQGGRLLEWSELGIEEDDQYNYQDIFYMYNTCRTIESWFKEHSEKKDMMKDKILNHVKLIVNLPQINSDQEFDLFDNLNGKRVPLDGADLIRAIVITRVARKDVEDIHDPIKHDVILNENRIKNGLKLDSINNWWCNEERQNYFKYFTRNINSKGEHIKFDESRYPIDTLYKLIVQTYEGQKYLGIHEDTLLKGSGTIKLMYFEHSDNLCRLFIYIQDIQRLVEYWYDDSELYHLVMYCAVYLGMTFNELTNLWISHNRLSFISNLKEKIREKGWIKSVLKTTDDNGGTLSDEDLNFQQNWYDDEEMIPVMVLLDVIRIQNSKATKFPIANLDSQHFCAVKEDKEHIFPQTPLNTGYRIETLKDYIKIAYKCGYGKKTEQWAFGLVDYYWPLIHANENFRNWFNNKMTNEIIPLNSLGNVCLLQDKINRGYGNASYTQKHFDIMKKAARGEYIRPHVLDAFSKIMATEDQRSDPSYMLQWDKRDIVLRRQYIVDQIRNFLF